MIPNRLSRAGLPQGLAAALVLLAAAGSTRAEQQVDLALMLAVDVSESVDAQEAVLQRQGYVQAIQAPDVVEAILGGPHGRIVLSYVEWAGPDHYFTIIDWSMIDSRESAASFAARLSREGFTQGYTTSITALFRRARGAFERLQVEADRKVLDVSGDGPNNDGGYIPHARERTIKAGVTINGLPILNDRPAPSGYPRLENLADYYRNCVIGGAGSFQISAESFEVFAQAIRRKMVREIAARPAPARRSRLFHLAASHEGYDCSIGERQSRQRLLDKFESTGDAKEPGGGVQ